ncbi:MAG: acyl-CoA dehydrogenase [Burkholderiales bacterium]|nr:acyl-CoA dehydrogenase [Burkholderiales bacterium]
MQSKILSRRDLEFVLYELLEVGTLTSRPRYADHTRETFDAALDTCERMATELFEPHYRKSDQSEPRVYIDDDGSERVRIIPEVKQALQAFCQAGLMAAGQDYDLGGMQLPTVVNAACFAWFKGANVSTAGYPFLTIGNANLLLAHGSRQQIDTYVRPMMEGRFFGTMCLSEPQAGSSLADIKTRAEPQPDGNYRLYGNKMWISAGEHELSENIVHLVLAKIPGAPPGVKGISLFIVPKKLVNTDGSLGERNDVALAGLNHKMGYRGITNTLLNFGEGKFKPGGRDGAVGYLVGEPNRGLACMFHMMNEARIGVGMGAVLLGYTGYLHALDYARSRPQGRPPGAKDPTSPQVPIVEHADVRRMLLAQKSYVEGGLALCLYCARLVDEQKTSEDQAAREEAGLLLDILTPITKSWPSQWCLEANNLAIQVHGGYGYTRDYKVEQLYRDNRLNPIHEGTHGIQALDLLGRKVGMDGGRAFSLLLERMAETAAEAQASESALRKQCAEALTAAALEVGTTTRQLLASKDANLMLANASAYLEMLGHVVIAWVWLRQAVIAERSLVTAQGDDAAFYQGKLQACRYFFRYELPKTAAQHGLLRSLDPTCLEMRDAWF